MIDVPPRFAPGTRGLVVLPLKGSKAGGILHGLKDTHG